MRIISLTDYNAHACNGSLLRMRTLRRRTCPTHFPFCGLMLYSSMFNFQRCRESLNSEINIRVLEAMNCWLQNDTTASWMKVVKILKSIEKKVLAQTIEEKYINQPTPSYSTSQPQTSRIVKGRPQPAVSS